MKSFALVGAAFAAKELVRIRSLRKREVLKLSTKIEHVSQDSCLPLDSDANAPIYGGTCWDAWQDANDVKLWAADNCGANSCTWPQINSKVSFVD